MVVNLCDYAIVMLGPPGSGKGTQVSYLVDLGFHVVSVGDILRSNGDTVIPGLNATVMDAMSSGMLLPDDFICDVVKSDMLNKLSSGDKHIFIFDGFPRTVVQAEYLNAVLKELSIPIKYAFNFDVSDDIVFRRITGRFSCASCGRIYNKFLCNTKIENVCDSCGASEFIFRSDDNEESLKTRLSQYYEKSKPLVSFYQEIGLLFNINASLSSDDVRREIFSKIGIS